MGQAGRNTGGLLVVNLLCILKSQGIQDSYRQLGSALTTTFLAVALAPLCINSFIPPYMQLP
ncbi:uncharacterized protein PHACADRAFT_263085 [Phanerochaete carnosa HHB-10118-sp]|uniref:Uncharacterized protein n=1 Tax=Phanerochaete carnosa (strain HHB-10118-sp) TaxID=650164 RepID=K5UN09_PHACS|nr:uncharacterized protein PHACADRAFT_263085 [Phanerochaete carnosa HHB-10118-sp]EKM51111.1 hypothetical protein PHACADRAFT_263085 [Phanerochaete carnosa HHB-10118-sp]